MSHLEAIKSHNVFSAMERFEKNIVNVEFNSLSEEQIELLGRSKAIYQRFKIALNNCEQNYMSITWLNETESALVNLESNLATALNTSSAFNSYRDSCNTYIDRILEVVAKISILRNKNSFKEASKSFDEYSSIMFEYVKKISDSVDNAQLKVEEIEKSNVEFSNKCTNSLNTVIDKLNTEQKRLDNFSALYTEQMGKDKTHFTDLLAKFTTDNNSLAKTFRDEFEAEKNDFVYSFEALILDLKNKIEEQKENVNKIIEESQIKFDEHDKDVKKIVGTITANTFSAKYREVADNSNKRARNWHILSIVLMVVVSIFALFAFVFTINQHTTWVQLISRIFATTTIATGAAYAARQASKQEKIERYARKIEMEFVSIGPFIESLSDEKKADIKEEVARKIFGNPNALEFNDKSESYVPFDKLANVVKQIMEQIKKDN